MKADSMTLKGDTWTYFLGGKEVTEAEYHAVYPLPKTTIVVDKGRKNLWPMVSKMAMKVAKDQVDEANARNRAHGVNCTYDNEGHCHIPDEAAYKRLRKLEGVRHLSSYTE
jgi:hypothetical protein